VSIGVNPRGSILVSTSTAQSGVRPAVRESNAVDYRLMALSIGNEMEDGMAFAIPAQ
jgi:hypothetical protein